MHFDPDNTIVQLCARGMELEATQPEEAKVLFMQAWSASTRDLEKCIAAHYLARRQPSAEEKLHWHKIALEFALQINDSHIQLYYPSLYLNIAKCYEDMNDHDNAIINYRNALSYENNLPADGYGQMIRSGIRNGIKRVL
ncbi:MAG TPA: tetratricopeptide repeat protein [Parafilimonas sp.]|nr:tetratricopeptide repeat protein [Parafilimonas sp.]